MTRLGPPATGRRQVDSAPAEAEIAAVTERFVALVAHVSTAELRARAAASAFTALPAVVAVRVAGRLLRLARDRAPASDTLGALARALARGLVEAEFVAECLGLARSLADRLAEALFADGPAAREYDVNQEPFVDRRMRQLSPGEKRALSKSRDIDVLTRLAHEQDVRVINDLLANPRVTEREAVLVASRRPTHARILEAVLQSRFGAARRVRRAVAHNPYSPVTLAVRAVAGLTTPELDQVAQDDKVADPVRQHARALARGRQASAAERDARAPAAPPDADGDDALEALLLALALEDDDEEPVLLGEDGEPRR